MSARRLIVWRHGRTEWNHTDRFQGQADIELDGVGHAQAAAAAAQLVRLSPAAIWSSDLKRARTTAQNLAELTGLEVQTDPRLREIHVDDWEGLYGHEVAQRFPEKYDRIHAGLSERRGTAGETVEEVAERFAAALTDIVAKGNQSQPTVVATHGLAARVGVLRWLEIPGDYWHCFGGLANCAWIVLEHGRVGWRIVEWNAHSLPQPVKSDDKQ